MKNRILLTALFLLGLPANALACGAYPVGTNTNDLVVGMVANGSNLVSYTSIANAGSSRQGMLVYNRTNNTLHLCNGGSWVALMSATGVSAAGTTGQVQFNNAGVLGADAGLFWDNTNKRLGIGTNAPKERLELVGRSYINPDNLNDGTNSNAFSVARNATNDGIRYTQAGVGAVWMGHSGVGIIATDLTPMTFKTGVSSAGTIGSTGVERLRIDNNGNVGIGTANPTYHLQVESTLDNQLLVTGKGTSFGGSMLASIYSERTSASPSTDRLLRVGSAFAPDSFGVFGNGNVGIGTTSIDYAGLQIGAGGTGAGKYLTLNGGTGTGGGSAVLFGANATPPYDMAVGHYSAIYGGTLNKSLTLYSPTANVLIPAGNIGIGTTANPTYHLQVESTLDNQLLVTGKGTSFGGSMLASIYSERTSASPSTDRLLRVGSAFAPDSFGVFGNGNVGIGTTNPSSGKLTIAGYGAGLDGIYMVGDPSSNARSMGIHHRGTGAIVDMYHDSSGWQPRFSVAANGNTTIWGPGGTCTIGDDTTPSCTSDARLKTDIVPIEGALEKLLKISGVRYRWKDKNKDQSLHLGLLAQDVAKVFPEAVSTIRASSSTVTDVKTLEHSALIAPMIEAIKELKAANDQLRAEFEAYKAAHP